MRLIDKIFDQVWISVIIPVSGYRYLHVINRFFRRIFEIRNKEDT
jgi:hypothetical protein